MLEFDTGRPSPDSDTRAWISCFPSVQHGRIDDCVTVYKLGVVLRLEQSLPAPCWPRQAVISTGRPGLCAACRCAPTPAARIGSHDPPDACVLWPRRERFEFCTVSHNVGRGCGRDIFTGLSSTPPSQL